MKNSSISNSRSSLAHAPSRQKLSPSARHFQSLSVKDLMDARDAYHYHLMNKENVVGTAVGLYLIRNSEAAQPEGTESARTHRPRPERRFDNSSVQRYSWPCVLVLVNRWIEDSDFGFGKGKVHPNEMVPKTLFLADGRVVPVCVVKVTPVEFDLPTMPDWHWPDSLLGGGMPVTVDVQGQEHMATVGCLATDGHTTYALTSRHVCGPKGTPVKVVMRGERVLVGRSSGKELTRLAIGDLYPSFAMRDSYLNLDVGLIEVADVNDWTSQIYGLGEVGPVADVHQQTISLDLISEPVIAQGAASGRLQGEVKALFYRYKSIGGFEFIADYLIGPTGDALVQTQPGDSGAVWHLAPGKDRPVARPLAIEWGGQTITAKSGGKSYQFALATSLSHVCRLLDVDLVRAHNTGVQPYWGQTGHYSIASFACDLLPQGKIKRLMKANIKNISFEITELSSERIGDLLKQHPEFVPLADVPDLIWKNFPSKKTGGRDNKPAGMGRSTGPEHPTHFADMDEKRPSDGKTLRQLSLEDPANQLTPAFWGQFFDECGHPSSQPTKRGLLPFRVWQFYDAMVVAARAGDVDSFVCAAGLVSHYVGDACQPLHGSILADGYDDRPVQLDKIDKDGNPVMSHEGAGVHSAYETAMIDRYSGPLIEKIKTLLSDAPNLPAVNSGAEAALAIVQLMDRSAKAIPPKKLVDAFIAAGGTKKVAVYDALWTKFGKKTAEVMLDGANVLAMVWRSAWTAGSGQTVDDSLLTACTEPALMALYTDPEFVPSLVLDDIASVLH